MKMMRLWLVAGVLLLAACGGGSNNGGGTGGTPSPNVSPTDMQTSVKNYQTSSQTDINQAGTKLGKLFNGFPSGILNVNGLTQSLGALAMGQSKDQVLGGLKAFSKVFAQSASSLPRGIYDCTSGTCPSTPAPSSNLVVKWIPQSNTVTPATLTVNWISTVQAHSPSDSAAANTQEVPTQAEATLVYGSTTVMDLTLNVAWHASSCASGDYLLDVPDSLKITGYIHDASGVPILDLRDLEFSVSNTTITTKGDFTITGDSGSVSSSWNININGTLTRNSTLCGALKSFNGTSVDFDFKTSSGSDSAELKFSASGFDTNPPTIQITGGYLNLSGKVVTFQGTLDDTTACPPGQHVILSFSGGQTETLQQFLTANGSKPCVKK